MLIAVDKPHGITSFDVIRKIKPYFVSQNACPKKGGIGHSGTLDPFATGLMLIGMDKDTKRLTELTGLDKSYIATIDFSQDSDTRDLQYRERIKNEELRIKDGKVIGIVKDGKEITAPTLEEITTILDKLIPSCELPLTPFSAKKKDGKKLYELAREGVVLNEFRIMNTNAYKIIKYEFPILELQLDVGSGTYIRSIAHWLGSQFGLGGILTGLRRTSIGKYDLNNMDMKIIEGTEIKFSEVL